MKNADTASVVAHSYDAQAAAYDRRWATYVARSTELTLAALPALAPGARVLDVGCGTGHLLAALRAPGLALTGVDISEAMLARAAERLGEDVALYRAPAEQLPFGDGAFEAAVTASSLHYWRAPERGLAEIARVLAIGGVLVVTDWCRESWRMRLMDRYLWLRDPAHHHALTRDELAALTVEAGFRVEYHRRYQVDRFWQLQVLTARRSGAPLSPHG